MKFDFEVPGRPATKGSWRALPNGRLIPDNKRAKPFENLVAIQAAGQYDCQPTDSSVVVTVACYFRRPKSHYRTGKNAHLLNSRATANPISRRSGDLDKIARTILDAMTGVVYHDDAQVIALRISKHWTEDQERTIVKIETLVD